MDNSNNSNKIVFKVHRPSKEIAVECTDIPEYKTGATKRSLEKFGEYSYDHPELDDPDAIYLPAHKFTNQSIFIGFLFNYIVFFQGTWKLGVRHGHGQ